MFVDLENFMQQQADQYHSFAHPGLQTLAGNVVSLTLSQWAAKIQRASNVGATGSAG